MIKLLASKLLFVGAAFALLLTFISQPQIAQASSSWSTPVTVGVGGVNAISCVSSSFCVAVDDVGGATVYSNGSWGSRTVIDGSSLNGVSCMSDTDCIAVDSAGNYTIFNGTSWSSPSLADSFGIPLLNISCGSQNLCMSTDAVGMLYGYDGNTWNIQPPSGVGGVACAPSSSFCVVENYPSTGNVTYYDGSNWSSSVQVDNNLLSNINCASSNFCVASDATGNVYTYSNGTWDDGVVVDTFNDISSLSCASSSFCIAADGIGNVSVYDGTSWSTPASIDNTGFLALSCPTSSYCGAADYNGYYLAYNEIDDTVNNTGNIGNANQASSNNPTQVKAPNTGYGYYRSNSVPYSSIIVFVSFVATCLIGLRLKSILR